MCIRMMRRPSIFRTMRANSRMLRKEGIVKDVMKTKRRNKACLKFLCAKTAKVKMREKQTSLTRTSTRSKVKLRRGNRLYCCRRSHLRFNRLVFWSSQILERFQVHAIQLHLGNICLRNRLIRTKCPKWRKSRSISMAFSKTLKSNTSK